MKKKNNYLYQKLTYTGMNLFETQTLFKLGHKYASRNYPSLHQKQEIVKRKILKANTIRRKKPLSY